MKRPQKIEFLTMTKYNTKTSTKGSTTKSINNNPEILIKDLLNFKYKNNANFIKYFVCYLNVHFPLLSLRFYQICQNKILFLLFGIFLFYIFFLKQFS